MKHKFTRKVNATVVQNPFDFHQKCFAAGVFYVVDVTLDFTQVGWVYD